MMNDVVPVIIIGAGISGIAASTILTQKGIKHIILESRNRIGGRILATDFNGDKIQLGASFVHHPQDNCVAEIMKELSWPTISGDLEKQQVFCEGVGELSQQIASKGWVYYNEIAQNVKQQASKSEEDISVTEAASKYVDSLKVEGAEKLLVKWVLEMYGSVDGAQSHQLSAKQYQICVNKDDYLLVGGYDSLLEAIVKKYSPQIMLNERVIKVNYQQSIIKLTTESGKVYQCQRVISSLPLGVLKKNVVQFQPQLPQNHKIAIEKIGNGINNKLFVSFQQPFWDLNKKWIDFFTSGRPLFYEGYTVVTEKQYMICFFVSGDTNKTLGELSKQDLIKQLSEFFAIFKFEKEVRIKDVYLTAWHKDPNSLGSYSYSKVGTERKHFSALRQSIQKKLWFIGEHCNEVQNACVHSAYQTGVSAAKQISEIYHSK